MIYARGPQEDEAERKSQAEAFKERGNQAFKGEKPPRKLVANIPFHSIGGRETLFCSFAFALAPPCGSS